MPRLHQLKEDYYPKSVEFCKKFLEIVKVVALFPFKILWIDESLLTLKGWVNKQNYRQFSGTVKMIQNPRFDFPRA